jgi:prefoldin subunit 5
MRQFMALGLLVASAVVPGCGGGPRPEDEEKRKAELDRVRLEMNQKFADLETRYAGVLKMEQTAQNALERANKMSRVTGDVVNVLKRQEAALTEYLRAIQDAIKALETK